MWKCDHRTDTWGKVDERLGIVAAHKESLKTKTAGFYVNRWGDYTKPYYDLYQALLN